jgi:2,4-dichlorophenol 6-monooxygenase
MHTVETDVLVVGAGPAGLAACAFLGMLGVPAITISRYPGTAPQPRATITNQRTVEIFRDLGIEDRVQKVGIPLKTLGNNVLATSFTGQEIFRYPSYGTGARMADYAAASPCDGYDAAQHLLEPELVEAAVERGADVRFSHELLDVTQSEDAVVSRVRDAQGEYLVRSRYVIGADGSRSRIAEQLGFRFDGQAALKHMLNMWIEVDLAKYTAHRPCVIYLIMQPGSDSWVGSGMALCVRPWHDWMLTRE